MKRNTQKIKSKNSFPKNSKPDSAHKTRGIWLFGKHPTFLALQKKRREIFEILVTKNSVSELENFLQKNNIHNLTPRIKIVEASYIEQFIGAHQVHQGIAVNCSAIPLKSQNNLLDEIERNIAQEKKLPTILILDQLTDPHNIGAIIRSACAFGVTKIVFLEHNFPKETATISKSSSGMIENVDLYLVVNISNLMMKLKELDYWCIGLAGEAKDTIEKISEFKNVALVIGSEGEGIRGLVKKNCDLLLKIPMSDKVESLNASVAAAISLWELS